VILMIDYRQNESKLLLTDQNIMRSFSGGRGAGFELLGRWLAESDKLTQPQGIAVVMPGATERMSWSDTRAAVSMANSLAFAWGVPAVRLSGKEEAELTDEAVKILSNADFRARVSALYDGEPNITKSKM